MRNLILSLSIMAALALFVVGCQNGPQPVGPENDMSALPGANFGYVLPEGAVFQSASLFIHENNVTGESVEARRITADWEEMVVTWNNFGGAYAPEVFGGFVADALGYREVDVSDLVQAWLNGDVENFGLLLLQPTEDSPRTNYNTSDAAGDHPYLEICYLTDAGEVCDTLDPLADTYIWENTPDSNYGNLPLCYTGFILDQGSGEYREKQTLIRFDIDPTEPEPACLGDRVWYDVDCDGIQDEGEMGVEGVLVELYTCDGVFVADTQTDANGWYEFCDLEAGDYYVKFHAMGDYYFSPANQGGDDAVDSDAAVDTGMTGCVSLAPGEYDSTVDAGLCLPEQEGCTGTIGYWQGRTGLGEGNQPDEVTPLLVDLWLGDAGGDESVAVTTAQMAFDLLMRDYCDRKSNGIGKLYAQLLGAKLNIASGASSDDVDIVIAAADAFLADNGCGDWGDLSDEDQEMVLDWKTTLDMYNNGDIGPGHCDDVVDDGDDD